MQFQLYLCHFHCTYATSTVFIHPRYNCNRYDEEEARAARDAQERSRSALQRYLFYCNRYMNHMQSLKFEHKLYASVKGKMEEMQHHNMSWIEVIAVLLFLSSNLGSCLKDKHNRHEINTKSIVRAPTQI